MQKIINFTPNYCKCGLEPKLVQVEDSEPRNYTWIECACGMLSRSYTSKDPLSAKKACLRAWNKKAKTRRQLKGKLKELRSCEKCGSNDVQFFTEHCIGDDLHAVGCNTCGLMTDDMDIDGESTTKEQAINIWNR